VDVPGWIYLTIAIIDSSIVLNSRNLDIIFFIRFFSDFIIRLFLVIEIIRDLNCWYLKAPVFVSWNIGMDICFWIYMYLSMATFNRSIVFNSGSIDIVQFFIDFIIQGFSWSMTHSGT